MGAGELADASDVVARLPRDSGVTYWALVPNRRGLERAILPVLEELDIAVTAYGVLSRGLLTGSTPSAGAGDFRGNLPRFSGDNRARNEELVQALARIAAARSVTPAQLCVAWVRAQGPRFVPLMGCRTRAQLDEALAALAVTLSDDEVAELERALPADQVAGERYPAFLMSMLDSERA